MLGRDLADATAQLEALFEEAGQQHRQAFLETDGTDPDLRDTLSTIRAA
jgi:hypothetical protein